MTSDAAPASDAAVRCPQCSARRTPGASWCTQCYAPFDPPRSAADASVAAGTLDRATGERPVVPGVSAERLEAAFGAGPSAWDLRHQQAAEELDPEAQAARVEQMMAELSAAGGAPLSPMAQRAADMTSTPLGKVMLIGGGGAVLLSIGLIVMFLAGKLL